MSQAEKDSLLVIEADSYAVNEALKRLDPPKGIQVRFFTHADIQESQAAREFVQGSEVIVAEVMMPELTDYLLHMEKGPGESEKPWLGLMLFSSSLIPG